MKIRWDRPLSPRWLQRLGGSLAIAIVLFNVVAMRHFTDARDQMGAWSLAWVFPAGFAIWMSLEWLIGPWFGRLSAKVNRQENRRFEVLRAWGIPILVDWSVPALLLGALPAATFAPSVVAGVVLCLLLITLIHELGHALAVRRLGGQVIAIEMSLLHGRTSYFSPRRPTPPIPVAWAGVVAQLLVAVPVSLQWLARGHEGPLSRDAVLFFLGPWNALFAAINLLPMRGLDGAIAWKVLRRRTPANPPRGGRGWNR